MSAKDILVKPISSRTAGDLVKKVHYSGKIVPNSQLHFGVFLNDRLEGVLSFGASMDKRKTMGLVSGTKFNDFLELNRMAFTERLPKNSESRAISICLKIIKKNYPNIEWIISYADGTQCGDGTIYRASGFVLTGIKKNTTILKMIDGTIVARKTLDNKPSLGGRYGSSIAKENGAKPLEGFQFRYVYFLNQESRKRLSVKEIPYSKIKELGASMYLGKRVGSKDNVASGFQSEEGGANPTPTLQSS